MKVRYYYFIAVFVFVSFVFSQSTIEGTVSDESGNPLGGANVTIDGTSHGGASGADGNYVVNVPSGTVEGKTVVVTVSFIGYESASASVDVPVGGSVNQNFSLAVSAIDMRAVSVTALGFMANRDEQGSSSVSVAAADMTRSGESLMGNSLAAKASNVIVNAVAGDPGASTTIKVRGANTISGNFQPLIVVDGMPLNNSTVYGGGNNISGGTSAGTVQQSRINDLNANDIESVEVLKGASAAALWGSRAANGVVMITTKDGESGKMKMNYKRTMSFDEIHERIPMQDTWGQGHSGAYNNAKAESWGDYIPDRAGGADEVETSGQHFISEDGTFTQYGLVTKNSKETYVDSNWDLVFQTGKYIQDDFQVTGGDASRTFLFSYSRLRQDGIIRNSLYDRDNFRLNTKFRLSDMISMESKASYTFTNSNRIQQSSNVTGLMLGLLRNAPDFDITHYKGTYVDSDGIEYEGRQRAYRKYMAQSTHPTYNNPLWTIYDQQAETKVDRFIMTNEMTITPNQKTSIVIRAGIDAWGDDRSWFFPMGSSGSRSSGVFAEDALTNREANYDLIARRSLDLGSISMNVTAGYNWWDRAYNRTSFNISSFLVNTDKHTANVNTSAEASTVESSKLFIRSGRTYGLLSLAAMDNLFVNFSGVSENHSTISDPYFYPGMDVAYQFNDSGDGTLSFGKLRVAWGQVGVRPSAHRFETLAESGFTYSSYSDPLDIALFGGGYRVDDDKGNPDLKPELKTETEFGLDLRFLDDRLALSLTSYQNQVDDMLINVSKSPSTGYDTQYMNAATMENKGFELDGSYLLMNQADKALDLYFNWAKNENKVTDLAGTELIYLGTGSVNSVAIVGYPVGTLHGTGSKTYALANAIDTVGHDDGINVFTDDNSLVGNFALDKNGFPQITSLKTVLGDPNPDWRGTLGLNARWKNFNMNILFEHSQGGDFSPRTQWVLRRFGTTEETAASLTLPQDMINFDGDTVAAGTFVRGSIHDFGGGDVLLDEAWYRHGIGGGFGDNQAYNFAVKDATFSRIKELSLSYTYSSPTLRERTNLSSITMRWTARNLFAWYKELVGIDPATNQAGVANGFGLDYFTNPSTKSYLFTVSVNY